MQELIDLTKKVEVVLDLRKISNVKAQVCLSIDGSGSMSSLYRRGIVQKAVDRISAVAVKFDDNQELDVMTFSQGVCEATAVTPAMFGMNYVQKELLDKNKVEFSGTYFVPFMQKCVDNYFSSGILASAGSSIIGTLKGIFGSAKTSATTSSKSASGFPILCIVITDGDNSDKSDTRKLMEQMQDKDIYWQFVGIGTDTTFQFLKQVADEMPNVGFFHIKDLETVKDMELYKELINEEFAAWIKRF